MSAFKHRICSTVLHLYVTLCMWQYLYVTVCVWQHDATLIICEWQHRDLRLEVWPRDQHCGCSWHIFYQLLGGRVHYVQIQLHRFRYKCKFIFKYTHGYQIRLQMKTHLLIPKLATLFSASGWATCPYYLRPCCVNLLWSWKLAPIISFVYLQCSPVPVSMASNNVNTFLKSPNNKKLLCFVRRWRYKAKQGNSRIITK